MVPYQLSLTTLFPPALTFGHILKTHTQNFTEYLTQPQKEASK